MTYSINNESVIDLHLPSDNSTSIIATRQVAKEIGFDEHDQTLLAIVASELSTNIIRYAKKGSITVTKIVKQNNEYGIQIIAKDFGPGIMNIELAMTEHYSTSDGLGLGLPSVKRIMDEFNIQSEPGKGTLITTRKWMFKKKI